MSRPLKINGLGMYERARQLEIDKHWRQRREAEIRRILSFKAEFCGFLDIFREFVEGSSLGHHWQIQTLGDIVSVTFEDTVLDDAFHTGHDTTIELKSEIRR